jgi:hypothetical protein
VRGLWPRILHLGEARVPAGRVSAFRNVRHPEALDREAIEPRRAHAMPPCSLMRLSDHPGRSSFEGLAALGHLRMTGLW